MTICIFDFTNSFLFQFDNENYLDTQKRLNDSQFLTECTIEHQDFANRGFFLCRREFIQVGHSQSSSPDPRSSILNRLLDKIAG